MSDIITTDATAPAVVVPGLSAALPEAVQAAVATVHAFILARLTAGTHVAAAALAQEVGAFIARLNKIA